MLDFFIYKIIILYTHMLKNVDEEEKELIQIGTINNAYSAWFLTEDGLYEVLMQSRKPIAKKKQLIIFFPSFSEEVIRITVMDLYKRTAKLEETIIL